MARYSEERYDFMPQGRNSNTLIDLIREQGAAKRQQLQQATETQNRAIEHAWDSVGEGLARIPEERRANERARQLTEEHGWTGETHKQGIAKGEKEMAGMDLSQAGQKTLNEITEMEKGAKTRRQTFDLAPGANGMTHEQEVFTEEQRAPKLRNDATQAQTNASNASSAASGNQAALATEQILALKNARTKEEAATAQAKIVNTLVAAKSQGNDALYNQTLSDLSKIKSPAEVGILKDAADQQTKGRKASDSMAERTNIATAGAVARAETAQNTMLDLRDMANAMNDLHDAPMGSAGEKSAVTNFKLAAGNAADGIGTGIGTDRLSWQGVGLKPQMNKILLSKMAEAERELSRLKQLAPTSQQVADQATAMEAELAAISQQLGIQRQAPAGPIGGDRSKANRDFLRGGAQGQQQMPPPPGGRSMRGSGSGNGAPAPMPMPGAGPAAGAMPPPASASAAMWQNAPRGPMGPPAPPAPPTFSGRTYAPPSSEEQNRMTHGRR